MEKNPLVLRLPDSKRSDAIIELLHNGKPEFTTIISTKDVPLGDYESGFIALTPDRVDYIARFSLGPKMATFERRVSLSDFVPLDVLIDDWANELSGQQRARLRRLLLTGGRFTDALWRDAYAALRKIRPALDKAFKRHQKTSNAAGRSINRDDVESTLFEREALGFALETWGGSRARKEALLTADPISERAPYLNNLGKVNLREIDAIEHDSATIPGYAAIRKYIVGVAEFVGPQSKLTVLNANLKPLEEVLGVDLVYYNHVYRSFVLIQYKRMASEVNQRPCYRPESDANFKPECDRIDGWLKTFKTLPSVTSGHRGFRLATGPFYFKFCDLSGVSAFDVSLSSGFYLPYRLMQRLLRSRASKGPRGGRVITWDTGGRWLSNDRMMDLIRAGWIGSAGAVTESLEQILANTLSGKRSLIYALSAPSSGRGIKVRRDVLGRFTDASDPKAHREIL